MLRRAAQMALVKGESRPKLYGIDFLLGVHDISRMGVLRFKLDPGGPFLDDNKDNPTPPITHLRELEASVKAYEEDEDEKNGVALNVDMDNNALDFELAKSVGKFFQLNEDQMDQILHEIVMVVEDWRSLTSKLGISRADQETMSSAFRLVTG